MNNGLRDRIARVLAPEDWRLRDSGSLPIDHPGAIAVVRGSREQAQAVIDDLGLKEPRSSVNDPLMVRFETKAFRRGRP